MNKKIFRFEISYWKYAQEMSVFEVKEKSFHGGEAVFTRENADYFIEAVAEFFGISLDEADALIEKGEAESLFRPNAAGELHGSFGNKEVFFLEI